MTSQISYPIITERLRLRPHRAADAAWLYALFSREDVARFLPYEPWSIDFTRQKLAEHIAKNDLEGEAGGLTLAVELAGNTERAVRTVRAEPAVPIGQVLLWYTDRAHGIAEIGWAFDPAWQGKGYAAEAASALLTVAFEQHGVHRVAAQLDARNAASAALAKRLGMRREATLRDSAWVKGERVTTAIYAVIAPDRA
ncbi:GNAT family N-acetyltransferase [Leucobacter sp. HY1910]